MKMIVFVNDDQEAVESNVEWLEVCCTSLPDWEHLFFESIHEAAQVSADVLVVDISAVAPITTFREHAYGAILHYMDLHPGTPIIIESAVGIGGAKDVCNTVIAQAPGSMVLPADYADAHTLLWALEKAFGV